MLVLNRYEGESIIVGDDIEIFLVEVRTKRSARIGIQAPPELPVHRKEIYEAIKREKTEK